MQLLSILFFYGLIFAVGCAAYRRRERGQQASDLLVAGRSMPIFLCIATMTATWVGGGYINGTAEAIYDPSLGVVWTQAPWGYAISMVLGGLFFAGKMRRLRYTTLLDPFEQRYGKHIAAWLFIPALVGEVFWSAAILVALGTTFGTILGLDVSTSILVSAAVAVSYTLIGGLWSVAYTDVLQLFCLMLGLFIAIPFTACGVICCLLAIEATYAMQWRTALLWLVVGVAIDAIDGTFARLARVNEVLPAFDGALLDNVIDFANYVIVPALILHRASLLPTGVSLIVASAICLASAYQFCQADAKTSDHYFRGFPSYWNVTVLYLLALHLPNTTNLAIIMALLALVFVPIKYIYVTRTLPFQKLTLTLTMAWAGMMLVILWQLPDPNRVILYASLIYVAYYASMSVYLTLKKPNEMPTTD